MKVIKRIYGCFTPTIGHDTLVGELSDGEGEVELGISLATMLWI